ncbi:hypothetical protein BD779DRAFT_1719529 [Infundibulicybe gibba]|nr:hypothetical protein BD779DRAFT_1719529 [Infundibulicybe gibba]
MPASRKVSESQQVEILLEMLGTQHHAPTFPPTSSHSSTSRRSRAFYRRRMSSPSPSAVDIQNHLYTSFLEAKTADVALHVRGSWNAIYRLHRVVLIQSGFFRSLFTAGFQESESSPRLGTHYRGPDEIDIIFDDINITRAAFELCISRLYGGGPPLFISPGLVPSTAEPLTPNFPLQCEMHTPPGHHPATPRFLLSLLATSVYLSIPSLASQALSSILSTIGPRTVLQYLNFALGKPIGLLDPSNEPVSAVGLENVAQMEDDQQPTVSSGSSLRTIMGVKEGLLTPSGLSTGTVDPSGPSTESVISFGSSDDELDEVNTIEPSLHYGAISDKIGEAAACWLVRWAVDMLAYETGKEGQDYSFWFDSWQCGFSPCVRARSHSGHMGERWSQPKWVFALVSADTLFVQGERDRYEFAKSVVELRRRVGILEAEEKIWEDMFEHAIYYANMTMDDLISISQDISPTTKRPFVPISIIQSAQWGQSVLRHHITVRPPSSSTNPTSPASRDKELKICLTATDVATRLSNNAQSSYNEKFKPYFMVPVDSSLRIGDNGNNSNVQDGTSVSMDQLFTSCHSPTLSPPASPIPPTITPSSTAAARPPTSEANYFGIFPPRQTAATCIQQSGESRWSPYPPYRFAVEFWDLESLKEKSRLHSRTIWYAGSLYNVYVQVVRKKGQPQLGIYLHRQSTVDPIPRSSAPSVLMTKAGEGRTHNIGSGGGVQRPPTPTHARGPSLPTEIMLPLTPTNSHFSPSIHPLTRSMTPLSRPNSSPPASSLSGSPTSSSNVHNAAGVSNTIPATAPAVTPPQPYRDPRPSISAYFTISCASATGSSQTRFTSAPDVFAVSQSWGWKASSLRTEEYMDMTADANGMSGGAVHGKETSLRATVVLGLV